MDLLHDGKEAITSLRNPLDIARVFRIVFEEKAEVTDPVIDDLLKVNLIMLRPQYAANLFPRDEFARMGKEDQKQITDLLTHP
jgi:hypothetical protein